MIALVGGGGKTTTMLRLAAALRADHHVLVTTTTKIWPIDGTTTIFASTPAEARAQVLVGRLGSLAVLAGSFGRDGKLHGVPAEMLTALSGTIPGIILCEADGAAGRPLKVHGPGEPVIPPGASHVLVIAGLDCVGQNAGPDTVHRVDRYQDVTGGVLGQPIAPGHVARALDATANLAPATASPFFLLNKADSSTGEVAAAIASALRILRPAPRIFVTQRGDLVADSS